MATTSVTAKTMYEEMISNVSGVGEEYLQAKVEEHSVEAPVREALSKVEHDDYIQYPFSELLKDKKVPHTKFDFNSVETPDFLVTVYKDSYWEAGALSTVPTIPEEYLFPTEYLYQLLLGWELDDRVLVYGPPGTGKTTLIQMAAGLCNRPYIRINGRKDMESSNIFGSMDFDGEKTHWQDGDLPIAAMTGAVLNVDEPFVIPADIGMGLNPVLEKGGVIKLQEKVGAPEERIIVPRESFRVVYTDNTGGSGDLNGEYAGVDVQNTSTLDRFSTAINMKYLDAKDEVDMIRKSTTVAKTTLKKMVKVASLIRDAYSKNELSVTMSPRTLFSWAKKTEHYQNVHPAFSSCFTNKISDPADYTAVRQIAKTVFGSSTL